MKVLFVADPITGLNPAGDSTLAMARAFAARGHGVWWAVAEGVGYCLDRVRVTAEPFPSGAAERHDLRAFDWVFIRKDPPFDSGYVRLCWLLSLEERRVRFINRPSLLLRYHEKLLPLEGLAQGYLEPGDIIPTFIEEREGALAWFDRERVDQVVTKPFLGYGGRDIRLTDREAYRREPGESDRLAQPFSPEVRTAGDRRVLYLEDRVFGHFVRMPPPGGFVSNLAQGGRAVKVPMSPAETALAERVGKFLKAAGIVFAGADFIGPRVSEINVTSPTGLKSLEALEGSDGTHHLIEYLERPSPGRKSR